MKKVSFIDWVAYILIFVGALNWGLVGVFKFDLVAWIFGPMSVISRIVYILVGLAALYSVLISKKFCAYKFSRVEPEAKGTEAPAPKPEVKPESPV